MSSMRDIKKRITNVTSTEQLIKAMYTIASSKLHKVREQLDGVRPIYTDLKKQVEEIGEREAALKHDFFKENDVNKSLYIVITSDRGYVSNYNSQVLNLSLNHMKEKNENILSIGSKGFYFFRKKDKNIVRTLTDISDAHVYYGSESLSEWATEQYLSGKVDEVFVVYTQFLNVLTYEPVVERILPIASNIPQTGFETNIVYEPDLKTMIDYVVPLYLHMNLFRAISESHTSEQAARMVSMDNAGNNASDLIKELTLNYNRQRQAAITQELSEIVGGTNFE